MSPRVVFGVPVFEKAAYLEEAVRSLLDQTAPDLAVVVIDDGSSDGSVEVARRLATDDPRVEIHVNPRRIGMLANTNRALSLALERHPEAEFWALGSDHDVWAPDFCERLVALLDAEPGAVAAYGYAQRIDEHGRGYPQAKPPIAAGTVGIAEPVERLEVAFRTMAAGNMIYALFRVSALRGRPLYRPVLVPDRLALSELALRGTFAVAPEVLWRRRFRGLAELDRQRLAFFLDAVPWWARLPWWAQHTGALALAYGVRREFGWRRTDGLRLTRRYLLLALNLRFRRRRARVHRRMRRYRPRRIVRRAANRALDRYGERGGRLARRGLDASRCVPGLERRLRPRFERVAERLGGRGQP